MKLIRFLIPRTEYILLIAIFWGIVASGPRILNFDGDLPRHVLTGNLILQTQSVPTTDTFSFRTTGYPSYPHEWLSQVIFAAAYNWLGLDGVILLTALVIMLAWAVVYRQAMRSSNSLFLAVAITALGVGASQIHVLPRPHIFTYSLSAVLMTLLDWVVNNRPRFWWTLPVVMLLWVHMHGMFVLGILLLLIYLIGDFLDNPSRVWLTAPKTRALLLGTGFSLVATLLSPSGPRIWETIASLGSNAYITARIPEYQSANFHLPETWPFILLLLLTIVGVARAIKRPSWVDILLVIAFTGMALYSSRMIPVFAVVISPVAAKVIADWIRNEYSHSRLWQIEENILKINSTSNGLIWILAAVLTAILLLRSGVTLDPEGRGNAFDPRFFPVEAVSWLESHPQTGHMFNEFDWGGYLLLKLWPHQKIFMDGHTHIYGEALTREYEHIISLSTGWKEIMQKYDIDWVITRSDAALVRELSVQENWEIIYGDTTATILIRR